jgi:hypothetical protein
MNFAPRHIAPGRRALIAALAIAALAPGASWAQAAATSRAPATAGSDRVVTPNMLAKMLKLAASIGIDSELPPSVATALGLSTTGAATGQAWLDRQFAVQSNATGTVHAVAFSRANDGDMVLSVRGPAAISIFRIHRDGVLVSAVNFFPETKQTTPLSPLEAQDGYAAECVFWLTNLDPLVAAN